MTNSKYTIWTFVPLNLAVQFSHFMNQYFLLIACLQLVPQLTPVDPATTWVPLTVIFAVSAIKEAVDDWRRHRADAVANARPVTVLRNGTEQRVPCEQLCVGELVRVTGDDEIPCDMVLLKTSDEHGVCYVQTANIDGETDFKTRTAVAVTQRMQLADLVDLRALIECEPPNSEIYRFEGRLRPMINAPPAAGAGDASAVIPLGTVNVLLQGTHLRNAHWALGVCVYAGNKTKLGMNKGKPPIKWTKMDRRVNRFASRPARSCARALMCGSTTRGAQPCAGYLPPAIGHRDQYRDPRRSLA